jgi:hypothetical protein
MVINKSGAPPASRAPNSGSQGLNNLASIVNSSAFRQLRKQPISADNTTILPFSSQIPLIERSCDGQQ